MKTLKELRTELGINQSEVANRASVNITNLCQIENGMEKAPNLEDLILIEAQFGQPLDWTSNEQIYGEAHSKILEAITLLCQKYPLISVLNAAQKWIKTDLKTQGNGEAILLHFARVARIYDESVMLPTELTLKRTK